MLFKLIKLYLIIHLIHFCFFVFQGKIPYLISDTLVAVFLLSKFYPYVTIIEIFDKIDHVCDIFRY